MKTSTLVAILIVAAIPVLAIAGYAVAHRNSSPSTNTPAVTPTPTATPSAPADAVSAHQVVLATDKGNITINLYPDKAPWSVKNFATLGTRGYYNGIIFHRVIKNFMIQGGDPTGTGTGGESAYGKGFGIEVNNGLNFNEPGMLGMARTSDPNSNGSQFFITVAPYTSGNNQYTVFGKVADSASMAVVTAIDSVDTDSSDKPTTDVHITGFTITQP